MEMKVVILPRPLLQTLLPVARGHNPNEPGKRRAFSLRLINCNLETSPIIDTTLNIPLCFELHDENTAMVSPKDPDAEAFRVSESVY